MIVKVFANFREICQGKTVEVPNNDSDTVISILENLVRLYPSLEKEVFNEERDLMPFVHVFINGRNIIQENGLQTIVKPGDQFALFPPVAGG